MSRKYGYSTGEVIQKFSENTYNGLLAANTEQTLTVPNIAGQSPGTSSSQLIAIITALNAPIWVALNATVAVPTTTIGVLAGEGVTVNSPLIKIVAAGDVLHFIGSTANTQFGVKFYVGYPL